MTENLYDIPADLLLNRIPSDLRLAMAHIDKEWDLLISWLPGEWEDSNIDAKTLVRAQWEKSKAAYRAMGMEPQDTDDEAAV